jgi:hypothetical protein
VGVLTSHTRPQSAQSSRVIPTLLLASVPFERLAAEEHELKLKAHWKGQARAYRKLGGRARREIRTISAEPARLVMTQLADYFIPALRFDFIRYETARSGGDHQP